MTVRTLPVATFLRAVAAAVASICAVPAGAEGNVWGYDPFGLNGAPRATTTQPPPPSAQPPRNGTIIVTDGPVIIVPGYGPAKTTPRPGRLPAACMDRVRVNGRDWTYFDDSCLERYGIVPHTLPAACVVTFRSGSSLIYGHDSICLRDAGFLMAGY